MALCLRKSTGVEFWRKEGRKEGKFIKKEINKKNRKEDLGRKKKKTLSSKIIVIYIATLNKHHAIL